MAEPTKNIPINGGTLISDLKKIFSLRTKRTVAFAYGFMFAFVIFTIFLTLNPPPSTSTSPWFSNIFSSTSFSNSTSSPFFSKNSNRSQYPSIFSYFFSNSTSLSSPNNTKSPYTTILPEPVKNQTQSSDLHDKIEGVKPNQTKVEPITLKVNSTAKLNGTQSTDLQDKIEGVKPNLTKNMSLESPAPVNLTVDSALSPSILEKNATGSVDKQKNTTGSVDKKVPEKLTVDSALSPSILEKNATGSVDKQKNTTGSVDKKVPEKLTVDSALSPSILEKNATGSVDKQKNTTGSVDKKVPEKVVSSNSTSSLVKKENNDEDLLKGLMNCDLFDGEWVKDDSYPLYKPGSCPLIDEQFNCFLNGRPDQVYQQFKWKPKGCTLPRLDGSHMLELLRGKRLVFVGDSLNRNMWESLICILRNSVKDQSKVYEASGRHHFRSEPSYSFVFKDYNCRVEFFVSPFLVHEWEIPEKDGKKKETLRLDLIAGSAENYKDADFIIFNTGHWWTHDKTSKGKDYYQEGSHVYGELNVLEAFRKALTTWARWVDKKVDPKKSLVFFRGYSASHFSGGQWNSGGQCDHETEPIKNQTYLTQYPPKMRVLEKVLHSMKTPVSYLNITRLTDYRKDGHPSMYRKLHLSPAERKSPLLFQDCSHWCLPGVPDAWNEILYAELLMKTRK